MLKHFLFDLDHTLFDFDYNSSRTMYDIFYKFKLNKYFKSFEDFHNTYIVYNTELWKKYSLCQVCKEEVNVGRFYQTFCQVGVDDYTFATKVASYYLHNTSMHKKLMPYALSTIRYLYNKYTISIITNGFVEAQYKKIRHCGLQKYVSNIFISEELGAMKPTSAYFDKVFKSLNTNSTECVVVGDSPESDIKGALSLGIRAILYNSRNVNCDFAVETIKSLRDLQSSF